MTAAEDTAGPQAGGLNAALRTDHQRCTACELSRNPRRIRTTENAHVDGRQEDAVAGEEYYAIASLNPDLRGPAAKR
jgi:hypothetical protein